MTDEDAQPVVPDIVEPAPDTRPAHYKAPLPRDYVIPEDEEGRNELLLKYGYDPAVYSLLSTGGVMKKGVGRGGIVGMLKTGRLSKENAPDIVSRRKEVRINAMVRALENQFKAGSLKGNLVELDEAILKMAKDGKGISAVKAAELTYRLLGMIGEESNEGGANLQMKVDQGSIEALRDIIVALKGDR